MPIFQKLTELQKGNRKLSSQNFKGAMKHFERHTRAAPDDPIGFAKIGYCYQNTNRLSNEEVTRTGAILVSESDKKNAETFYLKALELDPDCLPAIKGMIDILPEQSERRFAFLKRALAISANYIYFLELGDYYRTFLKDFSAAYDRYREAIQHNSRYPDAYQKIIDISKRLDNGKEANWKEQRAQNVR